MPSALDKQSPIPLYYQLAEILKDRIEVGEVRPGDQLPAERALAEQYAISRMTVRQAITFLVQEGVLVARHGYGTFVAVPKLTYDALHLLGFTEEVQRLGKRPISRVLDQSIRPATRQVAHALGIEPHDPVVTLIRLRQADEIPLLLETTALPAAHCPGLEHEDLAVQSLYAVLEHRYGIVPDHARQTIEATGANEREAGLFGIAAGSPMLLVKGVTYDTHDRPTEYFKAVYRADCVSFSFSSQRNTAAASPHDPRISLLVPISATDTPDPRFLTPDS